MRIRIYTLVGSDKATFFKRPVVPGDRLQLEAKIVTEKRGSWKFECRSTVDGWELAWLCNHLCARQEDIVAIHPTT